MFAERRMQATEARVAILGVASARVSRFLL
jgi:hypothetical protein